MYLNHLSLDIYYIYIDSLLKILQAIEHDHFFLKQMVYTVKLWYMGYNVPSPKTKTLISLGPL